MYCICLSRHRALTSKCRRGDASPPGEDASSSGEDAIPPVQVRTCHLQVKTNAQKKPLSTNLLKEACKKVGGDLLSRGCAVPSARLGLTSLFGMGRGDPQRYNHQNIVWTTQAELAKTFVQATMAATSAATVHSSSYVPFIVPTLSRHAPCGGGGCKFRAISKARL